MSFLEFEPLPEITDVDGLRLSKLPALFTPFSVPFLEEKPQNPIIQRLQTRTTHVQPRDVLPKELLLLSEQVADNGGLSHGEDIYDIWEEAAQSGWSNKVSFSVIELRTLNLLTVCRGTSLLGTHCG